MTATEPARVAILGSCVSRDLLRISLEDEATCPLYIARQSFLSYDHPVSTGKPEEPVFDHNFQLACYRSDIQGSGLQQVIRTEDLDVLLIDITDERHGVYVSPANEVMTRSIDGVATGVYEKLEGWDHVDFGTPAHLEAFAERAKTVREQLETVGLFEKTLVILSPWASHSKTGSEAPLSMGKSADWANSVLPSYWKVFEDLGFTTIQPDPKTILTDPDHQWGEAPFHYVPAFYDSLAEQIRPYLKKAPTGQ